MLLQASMDPASQLLSEWHGSPTELLLAVLLAQPHVIFTTRSRLSERLRVAQYIELDPLSPAQVNSFLACALANDVSALARFTRSLHKSPALAEAVRVPAILQMAVGVEQGDGGILGDENVGTACAFASLYDRVFRAMGRRFIELWARGPRALRHPKVVWAAADDLLRRSALEGCGGGESMIPLLWPAGSPPDARLLATMRDAGLVDILGDGSLVEFAHRSIQEFFAAREILLRLSSAATESSTLDYGAHKALMHASNGALRCFAFCLAPDTVTATALLATLGVSDQASLPVADVLQVVAACLPYFRGLRELPLARTVREAAEAFWAAVERGELQVRMDG